MDLSEKIILITGADGGLGTALVNNLISKNIRKIYATGLDIEKLKDAFNQFGDTVIPLELDVTNTESIKACTLKCSDTEVLINNAGVEFKIPFLEEKSGQAALIEMKVNYIGVMELIYSFLPYMEQSKPTCIVNILSIGSLAIIKRLGTYCASKTAAHILTETIREELSAKGVKVIGAYMGYINTQMTPGKTASQKSEPDVIAKAILKGIENNQDKIYPDKVTQSFVEQNGIRTHFFE